MGLWAKPGFCNNAPIHDKYLSCLCSSPCVGSWHLRVTCPMISANPQVRKYFYGRISQESYWLLTINVFPTLKVRWCEYIIWTMRCDWNWCSSLKGWTISEWHWTLPAFFLMVLEEKIMEIQKRTSLGPQDTENSETLNFYVCYWFKGSLSWLIQLP